MLRSELASALDQVFNNHLQLDYDNSGYNVALEGEVSGIYITLDASIEAINRCVERGCNFLITHHPIIFRPIPNIDDGYVSEVVVEAIRRDVSIYSAHTNVDVMIGGLNDEICRMLGLGDIEVLDEREGGRIGNVPTTTVGDFAKMVKSTLGDSHLKTINSAKTISKLLVINGAGGGDANSIRMAIDRGVDAILTAELRYNLALECKARGIGVIEVGHYESEWPFIKLAERILIEAIDTKINIVTEEDYLTPYDKETI